MDVYHVGTGEKAVIVVYEVFGMESGRVKLISDQLAHHGFQVILPDFFRSDIFSGDWNNFKPWLFKFPWPKVKEDLQSKVLPFLHANGAKCIGMVGFCWGNWVVFHACAELGDIKAGASAHPSAVKACEHFGEDVGEIIKEIHVPNLVLTAGNDPDSIKPGGVHAENLKKSGGEVDEYKEQNHGWVTRGDLSDPKVEAAVKDATDKIIAFFKRHL
uniref:Dienelactone hydrolase domain-containing protein n=1 Tax=Arcella intermedia TaxID=1963864 RepID=A0A6B2LG48_9EUKA